MNPTCSRALRLLGLLAIALPLVTSGCNSGRVITYPVSGSVRFEDGEPVRFGVIEFRPSGGGTSARAKLNQEGRFILGTFAADDGAAAGNYQVIVVQHFNIPPRSNRGKMPPEHAEHGQNPHTDARVAVEFADYDTSNLRANVQSSSENKFDFVVKRYEKGAHFAR
jgi:hypothetical protein